MSEFKLPPISPLIGSTLKNLNMVLQGQKIPSRFYFKVILTYFVLLIASLFHWIDKIYFKTKVAKFEFQKPPLFIIGHWRTGTTLVHNLLTLDPDASFVSTYHSVFPNNLKSKWLFKTFMRVFMPKKRPGDDIMLKVNYPQEDEYALSNLTHNSYYHFFYFPSNYKHYYKESVRFESFTEKDMERWKQLYRTMVVKALINKKGQRAILKNPVNTGRIRRLIEIFPDSPFIFMMRNPVIVYLSSKKFFLDLLPKVCLGEFDSDNIGEMILDTYATILRDYIAERKLIPSDKLAEVFFEEFAEDPQTHLKMIYEKFNVGNFDSVKIKISNYIEANKDYTISTYQIDKDELDLVMEKLGFAMKLWKYGMPENVEVVGR